MKSPQAKSVRLLQEKYQEHLENMFRNLLKDESLSDVTIHCKDGFVRAHRVILASCSPFFKKIFLDHLEPQVAFILHGVSVKQMRSLVELMYRGSTDISSDMMTKLYEVAEDFGVKGIVDENEKLSANGGRDTRFKGQKRVAVDFKEDVPENGKSHSPKLLKPVITTERRLSGNFEKSPKASSPENLTPSTPNDSPSSTNSESPSPITPISQEQPSPNLFVAPSGTLLSAAARRSNSWAMKQRKYKCSLCPASFKRASHLTRHQLVHTGERPYACSQCEKAFSRHDKLKHHIRKAHIIKAYEEMIGPDGLYTIGHVEIQSSTSCVDDFKELPNRITREDLAPKEPISKEHTPQHTPQKITLESAQEIASSAQVLPVQPMPPRPVLPNSAPASLGHKKGRGRPRKYPPVPKPLIKRPRGRPRLNPIASTSTPKLKMLMSHDGSTENYDITNMPFGDFEYLTKPLTMMNDESNAEQSSTNISNMSNLMEPLVEINLEQSEHQEQPSEPEEEEEEEEEIIHTTAGTFLHNIGLLETRSVAQIGECTISVAGISSSSGS